ncbi:MAG: hypothetical protein ABSH00_11380 [Bryobacteraceae bacterium]|jgi:hypothetical protein
MDSKAHVPALGVPPEREVREQIDRIVGSSLFQSSETLRHFLLYLAKRSVETPYESVKAKEVAAAVFGRAQDFDSQEDSIVRVEKSRLRSRLAEYYASPEGADDSIVVSMPKGSYSISAVYRHDSRIPALSLVVEHESADLDSGSVPVPDRMPIEGLQEGRGRGRRAAFALTLVAVVAIAFYVGGWVRQRKAPAVPPALTTFWRPFVAGDSTPLLVFSNFQLVGSFESGLRETDRQASEETPVIDTYTSVGEVMGVFEITRMLSMFSKPVWPKRRALLTWDEAKSSNLIFVGGPLAETPMRDTTILQDFQFRNRLNGVPGPSGAIMNLHPLPGEEPVYYGPTARPFQFDYAVIAWKSSTTAGRQTLALAGITEFGTQAAAEYVTREAYVGELLGKLHVQPGQPVPLFEALLRTTVTGGVPTWIQLVSVHRLH